MTVEDLEREWDEWLARPDEVKRATGGVYAFFRFKELQVARYRAELEHWRQQVPRCGQPPAPPWRPDWRCERCGYEQGICACGSIGSGVEQSAARQAHNLEDAGANPAPATYEPDVSQEGEGAQGGDRYRAPDPFALGMPVTTEGDVCDRYPPGAIGFVAKSSGYFKPKIANSHRLVLWTCPGFLMIEPVKDLIPIHIGTMICKGDERAMVHGIAGCDRRDLYVGWKESNYCFDEETLKDWRVELSEG